MTRLSRIWQSGRRLRKSFFGFLVVCALAIGTVPAFANQAQDQIIRQLRQQGFEIQAVNTTLLRRVRIVAVSPTYTREVVFNPRTGEILRDHWEEIGNRRGRGNDDDDGGSRGGGGGGGRDDDDDSGGNDDDDDGGDDDDDGGGGDADDD